jgi:hypothetical protein
MNKLIVPLGVLAGLAFTNPSTQLYTDYLTHYAVTEIPEVFCKELKSQNLLKQFPESAVLMACEQALDLGGFLIRDQIETFLNKETKRQNFVIVSVYTTRFPSRTVRAIGVLNNFILLPGS